MSNLISICIAALLRVESCNGLDVIGDNGSAVGVLQMHRCAVRQANVIVGYRKWTYADRMDYAASVDMCRTTLEWHYRRGVRDPVNLACRWNRPDGSACRRYREKVWKAIKEMK